MAKVDCFHLVAVGHQRRAAHRQPDAAVLRARGQDRQVPRLTQLLPHPGNFESSRGDLSGFYFGQPWPIFFHLSFLPVLLQLVFQPLISAQTGSTTHHSTQHTEDLRAMRAGAMGEIFRGCDP